MKKSRVLVPLVEAGMGHITSAMSVADSLEKYHGDELDVLNPHLFRDSGDASLVRLEKFLATNTKAFSKLRFLGPMYTVMMEAFDPKLSFKLVHDVVFRGSKRAALKEYAKYDPNIIASTHFTEAHFAKSYQTKIDQDCKVVTYNPDPDVHGWWGNETDMFIVNNSVAYDQAVNKRGFDTRKVKQVPFIIRDAIEKFDLTKEECRKKHNIPADKFTVVLTDSVYGASNLESFTDELLKTKAEMTVMPAVGRNEKLMERYTNLAEMTPKNIDLIPIGFRLDLFEFFKAADVVVTKAGPNTLLDCGFMGTPVIVNYYATPTEKFSRDLFVETYGMGEIIGNAEQCRERLEKFSKCTELLDRYRDNARNNFDRKNTGGKAIADIIYNM